MTETKLIRLDSLLRDLKSFVIAFSGGVDSSFLVHRSGMLGAINVMAVTIRTPYMPAREINEAAAFAKKTGISNEIVDLEFPEIIRHNPAKRCYLCKKILFSEIANFARKNNFKYVIDGTNADDVGDLRPGLRALRELDVRSPLAEAGLTKSDIRELSQKAGLPFFDKPSTACLLTRIPYDTTITEEMLRKIDKAEDLLFENGYPGTRVRMHGDIARIECMPGYIEKIIHDPSREQIVSELKKIGFRYISLDLEGYRSGSMDPENVES
jgi:pyridinium-3,5-biscarboxylic acid mononucleotide sulfurtransferase